MLHSRNEKAAQRLSFWAGCPADIQADFRADVPSRSGKPNQRKVSSWTFCRGKFAPKFDVNFACSLRKRNRTPNKRFSKMISLYAPRIWRVHFLPNPTLQSCSLAEPWPVQRWYLADPSKMPNLKPWIWRRIILPNPGCPPRARNPRI